MPGKSITDPRGGGLSIGDLSRRTGVNIETIRYYEKIKLIPAPPRTAGGRRAYGTAEARLLAFVRRSRELGFTLNEIRALLELGGPGVATCAEVCSIATRHVSTIRAKIADLQRLERFLADHIARCSGDAVPDCAVLDALYPAEAEAGPTASS